MVFGGSVLTASDVAVAGGIAEIGSRDLVKDVDEKLVKQALKIVHSMVEDNVDRVKVNSLDQGFCSYEMWLLRN